MMLSWIGSILLALCGFPETIRTIRDGRCHIGWGMLIMWYLGELLTLYHVIFNIKDAALSFNYILNVILISIMLFYKIRTQLGNYGISFK